MDPGFGSKFQVLGFASSIFVVRVEPCWRFEAILDLARPSRKKHQKNGWFPNP